MKVLLLHPSCLMYAEIYLRLEPLGLELVAASVRRAGHEVRIVDLQVQPPADYFRELENWRPDAVGFSLNYLANVPEVLDLALHTRRVLPDGFLFAGGHSASFVAAEILAHAVADEIDRRKIRKEYYLETRSDLLLRHREVFRRWQKLGLHYMFLGLEALDDEGLENFRKRTTVDRGMEALAVARSLGIAAAVNIIAQPQWDERQFKAVRQWAISVPEIVHLTVATPYPGTETWLGQAHQLTTRDYRLFDIQHAVLPTRLSLERFYRELVQTQQVLNRKHLGLAAQCHALFRTVRLLARGQGNFFRMLWKFNSVYNPARQLADHRREVRYEMAVPEASAEPLDQRSMYVHRPVDEAKRSV